MNIIAIFYCYSHLLPDYKKKFKTKVIKDTTNPVWNEKFVFEKLKLDDLRSNRVVELTVWDLVKNTKQYDFIGGLRLGPRPHHDKLLPYMDSSDTELTQWMSVINTPGQSVEQLHTLRHNMDPRTITIATSEPLKQQVTNETSANEEVTSYDVTQQEVIASHDALPPYESNTATMVTQPSIRVIEEGSPSPVVSSSHYGDDDSPRRTERLKFDDQDDDNSSTPSHQVIP